MKFNPGRYSLGFTVGKEMMMDDDLFQHLFGHLFGTKGYHADFCGRRYRRGRNRCVVCGARK